MCLGFRGTLHIMLATVTFAASHHVNGLWSARSGQNTGGTCRGRAACSATAHAFRYYLDRKQVTHVAAMTPACIAGDLAPHIGGAA
jgi:hypothetical protein